VDYLVGDVQGCCDAFERLLDVIAFSPSRDHLVLMGDLVNRGPHSLATLRRVRELDGAAACLLGNHDLNLLAVAHGVRKLKRGDTVGDILAAPDREALLDWLRQQPLALRHRGWLLVHAGVAPQWDADDTLALAAEVQARLRGPDPLALLREMYGDAPAAWDARHRGPARWRFVVNALTRIRYCTTDGALDLRLKEGLHAAPPGRVAWFDVPGRRTRGVPIAFGHWSTLGLLDRDDLLALDTGCVWGGALSAARIDGGRREIVQVPCAQAQAPG
jgi:bis(5'-nucleosyl)-tetraphosphatase (symmetrical)